MRNKVFNLEHLLKRGEIKSEIELERASIAERKLRIISKQNPDIKLKRKKLRELIYSYESKHWKKRSKISNSKLKESEKAEIIALKESDFIESRKRLIRSKLKTLGLNQQEFGKILGHESKSYMSELMNGIVPFTLKDLILISKLLKISLIKLIPTQLDENDKIKIEQKLSSLGNPKIKLNKENFAITR